MSFSDTKGVGMKIGIYARISTSDKGQDVNLQLNDLRTYAEARGFEIYKEYVDEGQSGSKERRPAFDQMMDDVKKRKVDGVLVWRLDRFGRSLKHLINVLEEMRQLGVSFISYHENIDFTTPTGQLMFHMLGSFAEFERSLIIERVKAGLENARRKGKKLGRPSRDIDVDNVKELYKTMSIRKVAETLGVSAGLVHKTLQTSHS